MTVVVRAPALESATRPDAPREQTRRMTLAEACAQLNAGHVKRIVAKDQRRTWCGCGRCGDGPVA